LNNREHYHPRAAQPEAATTAHAQTVETFAGKEILIFATLDKKSFLAEKYLCSVIIKTQTSGNKKGRISDRNLFARKTVTLN